MTTSLSITLLKTASNRSINYMLFPFYSMFEKYSEISNQMPDLFVTGNACEEQTLEALKRYSHRPYFVQKALSHLFSITHVSIFFS